MNIEKLIQTVAYILKKYEGFSLEYIKLIKILYLADKESIRESNLSITGDVYYAMENGPVLSGLYDLIRGKNKNSEIQQLWNIRFLKDGYNLVLLTERIPSSKLSDSEKSILDAVDKKYHNFTWQNMIEVVHNPKICPEWHKPSFKNSNELIEKSDILKSLGRTPEEIDFILEEDAYYEQEERVLATLRS